MYSVCSILVRRNQFSFVQDITPCAHGCGGRLYLGVLEDRLGVQEGGLPDKVSESDLLDSFKTSLKQRSKELPCFGAGVMSSEDWWEEVVRATFRGAGVSDKTLGIDEGGSGGGGGNGGVFGDVFDRLFHDVFTSTTAWELVPVRVFRIYVGLLRCVGFRSYVPMRRSASPLRAGSTDQLRVS